MYINVGIEKEGTKFRAGQEPAETQDKIVQWTILLTRVRLVPLLAVMLLNKEQIILYLKTLFKQIEVDLNPIKRKIIIDTMDLTVKEAYDNFREDCDIYCFGMPNEKTSNLLIIIREEETRNDWIYYMGKFRLQMICNSIINYSKTVLEECKKYNMLAEDEKRFYQRNLTRKGNYSLNQTAKKAR